MRVTKVCDGIAEFTALDGFGGAISGERRQEAEREREGRSKGREDESARRIIPVSNMNFISVHTDSARDSRGG